MTKQLPVLVYGTLRPTGGNYESFLEGYTYQEQNVTLDGFTMYAGSGYPYMVQGGDKTVVATLVYIDEFMYDSVLQRLDFLEGYHEGAEAVNHYNRIAHTFDLDGETITAWIYVASDYVAKILPKQYPVIEHGDWLKHWEVREAEWWKNHHALQVELADAE
jgi:gamma-glutamylcyclotransferase (GGCT)/AIG2-like uncharacterized protein YtfP